MRSQSHSVFLVLGQRIQPLQALKEGLFGRIRGRHGMVAEVPTPRARDRRAMSNSLLRDCGLAGDSKALRKSTLTLTFT